MSWTGAGNIVPRIIQAFAAPVLVSTETPLWPLTALGPAYDSVTVTMRNHDALLNAALYVDTSESGEVITIPRNIVIVPPLKEYSIDFSRIMRQFFSVSGSGDPDGGFAAVSVSFQIIGTYRLAASSNKLRVSG